jgi:hypothetical protein
MFGQLGGGLLHVDTFAHNKSGNAYQSKSRRSITNAHLRGVECYAQYAVLR